MGCFPGRVSGSPAGLSINRNDMPGHDITDFFAEFLQAEGKEFWFFSFFGENWGCPGLPFPFTPCGFHRDPGGTEGSGNEHQDPPQL